VIVFTVVVMNDIELDVGGTKFKGVYIAILLSFASTIGGGIWTASEFFNRLSAQEESVQDALSLRAEFDAVATELNKTTSQFNSTINGVTQRLDDNNVAGLQGKLAELGTNLKSIMERQSELLDLREKVSNLETTLAQQTVTVDTQLKSIGEYKDKIDKLQREIDDLWNGMDALSNPLR
jgi:chromosome segregation ATPase